MSGRGGVMPRLVLSVQTDTGRADIGMPQVVPHHLKIRLSTQINTPGMVHPVG